MIVWNSKRLCKFCTVNSNSTNNEETNAKMNTRELEQTNTNLR